MDEISSVIDFWLGPTVETDEVAPEIRARWWSKDPDFDAEIRSRFGDSYARAITGELDSWADTPRGRLALVILLDQFSRNLHRDSALAWSQDARAQALALEGLERGDDRALPLYGRVFLYMPLMHAEDRDLQSECVRRFEALANEVEGPARKVVLSNLDFARRHQEIVERFGRFPHRNAVLRRESTPEERAFLLGPNSSF